MRRDSCCIRSEHMIHVMIHVMPHVMPRDRSEHMIHVMIHVMLHVMPRDSRYIYSETGYRALYLVVMLRDRHCIWREHMIQSSLPGCYAKGQLLYLK